MEDATDTTKQAGEPTDGDAVKLIQTGLDARSKGVTQRPATASKDEIPPAVVAGDALPPIVD